MCVRRVEVNQRGAEIAGHICSMLGFSGYSFFNSTPVGSGVKSPRESQDEEFSISRATLHSFDHEEHFRRKREINPSDLVEITRQNGIYYEQFVSTPNRCPGMYIECIPHAKLSDKPVRPDNLGPPPPPEPTTLPPPTTTVSQTTELDEIASTTTIRPDAKKQNPIIIKTTTERIMPKPVPKLDKLQLSNEEMAWNAIIFVNGQMACGGILTAPVWIIGHFDCLKSISWAEDMVVAVLGTGGKSTEVPSPSEEVIRIDCLRRIGESDYILIHLSTPVQFNRHILPIMVPQRYSMG